MTSDAPHLPDMIRVRRYDGESVPVQSRIIGPLAVHRHAAGTGRWTITHVETGFALVSGLATFDEAVTVAGDLMALVPAEEWPVGLPSNTDDPIYESPGYVAWADRVLKAVGASRANYAASSAKPKGKNV